VWGPRVHQAPDRGAPVGGRRPCLPAGPHRRPRRPPARRMADTGGAHRVMTAAGDGPADLRAGTILPSCRVTIAHTRTRRLVSYLTCSLWATGRREPTSGRSRQGHRAGLSGVLDRGRGARGQRARRRPNTHSALCGLGQAARATHDDAQAPVLPC
jgi:hypothetical protein